MTLTVISVIVATLAAIPAILYFLNLAFYRLPRPITLPQPLEPVSILIPARNEEAILGATLEAALKTAGIEFEIIVLDDHSTDGTSDLAERFAKTDRRIRVESAPPLPEGWCGKMHACQVLGSLARHDVMLFIDADVRLAPDGAARAVAALAHSRCDFLSGVPRQQTGTFLERLLIPLIHWVLLGFLPMAGMRWTRHPAFAVGCGQLIIVRRDAYKKMGGHGSIQRSRHDGLALARAFRRAGFRTDLFDATSVAACRLYRSSAQVWEGLRKNAREGLAAPRSLVPFTVIMGLGQLLPLLLWLITGLLGDPAQVLAGLAVVMIYLPRVDAMFRFRQDPLSALLHPLGVGVLLAIQWQAWWRARCGQPEPWKGRLYQDVTGF